MVVKAVFDCMLYLQAVTNQRGVAFKCFQLAEEGLVELQVSPLVLAEVDDVLHRPELTAKFAQLTPDRVARFLRRVLAVATTHAAPAHAFDLLRDHDDEPYLDLAIVAGCQYLVTWNERHLTYLMRQDTPEGRDFCRRFPSTRIVTPPVFVRDVESGM